jgi:hypothetical protein
VPMTLRYARPIDGRQKRPAWRGTGIPPTGHYQVNDDSGTPTGQIPDNALTSDAAGLVPLVMDDGMTVLTTA